MGPKTAHFEAAKPKKLKSHRPEREQHFLVTHIPENLDGYMRREIVQIYLPATENAAILAFIQTHHLLKGHKHKRAVQHLHALLDISTTSKPQPDGTTAETQKQFRLRRVIDVSSGDTKFALCLKGLDVSQHPQTFIEKDEIEIEFPGNLLTSSLHHYFEAIDAGEKINLNYVRKTRLSRAVTDTHKKSSKADTAACGAIDIDFFHGLDPDNPDFIFALGEAEIYNFQKFFRGVIAEVTQNFGSLVNHVSSGKLAKIARKFREGKVLKESEQTIWNEVCRWRESEVGQAVRAECKQLFGS